MVDDLSKYTQHLLKQRSEPPQMGGLLPLVTSNSHIFLLAMIAGVTRATYRVRAYFTRQHGSHGDWIWVGGRVLLQRPKKFGPIVASEEVTVVAHSFDPRSGGSNQYPCLTYEIGATCELEFTSVGLPVLDGQGWAMRIVSLERIADYYG